MGQLADGERFNLFIIGHSQGGTSSVVYHLHAQSPGSSIHTMYELKQTIASAGHYDAAIWEASCMQSYADFTADAEVRKSFHHENMPLAREMQNVLLAHLLHTYKTTTGSGDITYEPAASAANT